MAASVYRGGFATRGCAQVCELPRRGERFSGDLLRLRRTGRRNANLCHPTRCLPPRTPLGGPGWPLRPTGVALPQEVARKRVNCRTRRGTANVPPATSCGSAAQGGETPTCATRGSIRQAFRFVSATTFQRSTSLHHFSTYIFRRSQKYCEAHVDASPNRSNLESWKFERLPRSGFLRIA